MKKGLPILTALTLVIITSSAWAGTQTWTFDAGAADWEAANGTWEVNGGVYQEVSGGEAAMHTLVGDVAWDNYTVEAKVRLDEGNWAGVIFRAQNEFEYYVFYLNVPDNKTEFWRHKQGAFDARDRLPQQNIPSVDITIANGEWFDVKAVIDGDNFTLFINDIEQGTVEDLDKAYGTGKIGLWAWQTKASFDDVKITSDAIADSVTSVDARRKLATKWGQIKRRY